jgi:5-methylthioadenosine/S-adenosylhomocysteine deaminase
MMRAGRLVAVGLGLAGLVVVLVIAGRGQAGAPVDLVVSGGIVVTMDDDGRVIADGAVAIAGDRIVAVGPRAAIDQAYAPAERLDARGHIVLPGLVNTHTHAPMVLFRGLADDLALMEWLNGYIFPAEKMVSPEFVRAGTRLAALEMIESGTTTFVDMYYFEADIAAVAEQAGLRAVLGQSVIQFPVADAATPAAALTRADAFLAEWKAHPRITPAVAAHSPYTLEPADLQASRAMADKHGMPLLIHLAETQDEVRVVRAARGVSPTAYLDRLGLWNGPAIAAHAVWLDEADLGILAARRVGLSHNPESNMKLASGVAAVPKWLERGIRCGLGTDGAASNNDLDMFEAMRTSALLHKVSTGDPRILPARTVLELATRRGADAIGLGDRVGRLQPGWQADLIAVSTEGARQTPLFDPMSHLVYVARGSDVRHTVVAGRPLLRHGEPTTLDRAEVLRESRAMADRVRAHVGPAARAPREAGK